MLNDVKIDCYGWNLKGNDIMGFKGSEEYNMLW